MDVKEELVLHQWAKDLADQNGSGLTQQQWCDLKGININTFRYRNRRVCRALESKRNEIVTVDNSVPEPVFAKVTLNPPEKNSVGIHIELKETRIHIAPDAPPDQIRIVLEVLTNVERS